MEYGVWAFFSSFHLGSQILPPLPTFFLISCAIRFILLLLSSLYFSVICSFNIFILPNISIFHEPLLWLNILLSVFCKFFAAL